MAGDRLAAYRVLGSLGTIGGGVEIVLIEFGDQDFDSDLRHVQRVAVGQRDRGPCGYPARPFRSRQMSQKVPGGA
jgi:hypothetical protein